MFNFFVFYSLCAMTKPTCSPPLKHKDAAMLEAPDVKRVSTLHKRRSSKCRLCFSVFLLILSLSCLIFGGFLLYTTNWDLEDCYSRYVVTVVQWAPFTAKEDASSTGSQQLNQTARDSCAVSTMAKIDCYPMGTQQQCLSKGIIIIIVIISDHLCSVGVLY